MKFAINFWSHWHIDFTGPIAGKMILVVIDARLKWIKAYPMNTANVTTTIQQLKQLFAQLGILQSKVSRNGPQFAAAEFDHFCKSNGIRHIKVAPYHQSSNGQAEQAVKISRRV